MNSNRTVLFKKKNQFRILSSGFSYLQKIPIKMLSIAITVGVISGAAFIYGAVINYMTAAEEDISETERRMPGGPNGLLANGIRRRNLYYNRS